MCGMLVALVDSLGAEVLYNANSTTLFYDFAPRLQGRQAGSENRRPPLRPPGGLHRTLLPGPARPHRRLRRRESPHWGGVDRRARLAGRPGAGDLAVREAAELVSARRGARPRASGHPARDRHRTRRRGLPHRCPDAPAETPPGSGEARRAGSRPGAGPVPGGRRRRSRGRRGCGHLRLQGPDPSTAFPNRHSRSDRGVRRRLPGVGLRGPAGVHAGVPAGRQAVPRHRRRRHGRGAAAAPAPEWRWTGPATWLRWRRGSARLADTDEWSRMARLAVDSAPSSIPSRLRGRLRRGLRGEAR